MMAPSKFQVWPLMAWMALSSAYAANILSSTADALSRTATKEISSVKHPVESTVFSVAFSQCDIVKKFFGISYDQMKGKSEPDLNSLTLKYLTNEIDITYNINAAAELIPQQHVFDDNSKLYIFVHGFTDSPSNTGFTTIREALMKRGEVNVIALDGSSLIAWLYLRSTTYVRFMGEKLGEVLAAMVNNGVAPSNIHMIGHSLGAQISGFTGKTFTNLTGQKLGRISGLDPAGPCFTNLSPDLRLSPEDADSVDVIHTDAGVFGTADTVGTSDYYPNRGAEQPDCLLETCSHSRAVQLYGASIIDPQGFPAVPCDSWEDFEEGNCGTEQSYMGFGSPPAARGRYFLQTGGAPPYAHGAPGARYTYDKGIVKGALGALG